MLVIFWRNSKVDALRLYLTAVLLLRVSNENSILSHQWSWWCDRSLCVCVCVCVCLFVGAVLWVLLCSSCDTDALFSGSYNVAAARGGGCHGNDDALIVLAVLRRRLWRASTVRESMSIERSCSEFCSWNIRNISPTEVTFNTIRNPKS